MNTQNAEIYPPIPTTLFRYVMLIVVGLIVGFVVGWMVRGVFIPAELERHSKMQELEEIMEDIKSGDLPTSSESDQGNVFREAINMSVSFYYGLALGGAILYDNVMEDEEIEACHYITGFLDSSGARRDARLYVDDHEMDFIKGFVTNILRDYDLDCESVIDEWYQ